jgi:flagellar hook assembly protein FlgD
VSEPGKVTLKVYDVAGRLVATLVDGHRGAGEHEVSWDGHSASGRVASGMYFARVQNGTESARSSIVMVQ